MTRPRTSGNTRRDFLDWILGSAVVGWLASVLYPVGRYLTPLPETGPTGPVNLTRGEIGKLEQDGFVIVPVVGKRVLVLEDSEGDIRALSARCTHEGCTVQYVADDSLIWCACHNAKFDLEGGVISGPPPKPLPRFYGERRDDGSVVINVVEQA
ncbi:MAG: Rieske 2Fe-2S domain-containing protein [Proteobacteria bacterium]|nr:Rieske 2Fe-2S domain-containing protein [Pseudomonadota bacterium]